MKNTSLNNDLSNTLTNAYLEVMIFAHLEGADLDEWELVTNCNYDDFIDSARQWVNFQVNKFIVLALGKGFCFDLDNQTLEQIGHDIYFSSHGYGVGFWGKPEIYGEFTNILDDIAKNLPENYIWVDEESKQLRLEFENI